MSPNILSRDARKKQITDALLKAGAAGMTTLELCAVMGIVKSDHSIGILKDLEADGEISSRIESWRHVWRMRWFSVFWMQS